MSPEDEAKPGAEPPATGQSPDPQRRRRRSGRGRRGRGRRHKEHDRPGTPAAGDATEPTSWPASPHEPAEFPEQSEPVFEEPSADEPAAEAPEIDHGPEAEETAAPEEPGPSEGARRRPPANLQDVIEQVNSVVDSLRRALEDMEEVLELLEVFERQSGADQREIDSLRRALRQFHRPHERQHRGRS